MGQNKRVVLRIAAVSCVWKRPQLDNIFLKQSQRLKEHGINSIIVGSSGENYAVQFPNNPVYEKWNYAVSLAKEYDYIIIIGSDDFMSNDVIEKYKAEMKKGIDFISMQSIHFYNGNLYNWGGYTDKRRGEPVGAFKCISKRLSERLGYRFFKSFPGMDYNFNSIVSMAIKIGEYTQKNIEGFTVDVKYKGTTSIKGLSKSGELVQVNDDLLSQIPEYKDIEKLFK